MLPSIHDMGTNSILLGLAGNLPFWTGLSNHTGEFSGGQVEQSSYSSLLYSLVINVFLRGYLVGERRVNWNTE